MKEKISYYAKLYITRFLPIALIIAIMTLIVLAFVGKYDLTNYLNVLFVEAAVLLIIAGIFSTIALFTSASAKHEIIISRLGFRIGYSIFFIIIGVTLLIIMFIVHFASKKFV